MIARVGNDLCPRHLRNEWLSPSAASMLPSAGLEICVSCATRGTCIRTHSVRTLRREAAITTFGDHPNATRVAIPFLSKSVFLSPALMREAADEVDRRNLLQQEKSPPSCRGDTSQGAIAGLMERRGLRSHAE
jgi:hypothetical protein